jgi:MFS family permease
VSWYAHHIEFKLKQKNTLLIITLMIAGCTILTGLFPSYWGLLFLFLFYMTRGLATPVLKDYINRGTESHVRATVLSIRNFMIRLVFAIVGPILGYMTDNIGLSYALILSGSLFLCFGLISTFLFIKVLRPIDKLY